MEEVAARLTLKKEACNQQVVNIRVTFRGKTLMEIKKREEQIQKMGLFKFRGEKKICLVLDLDHTVLHSKSVRKLSSKEQEKYLKNQDLLDQKDVFRWKSTSTEYITKLRPCVQKFLEETSKLFELYIFTMGSRDYAFNIAKILDPQNMYFGSRILSKANRKRKREKGLDFVPAHESSVIILDDTESVWANHLPNLIVMKKYNYFAHKSTVDGRSLSEEGRDEESTSKGSLSHVLEVLKKVHRLYFDGDEFSDVREILKSVGKEVTKEQSRRSDVELPLVTKKQRCQ